MTPPLPDLEEAKALSWIPWPPERERAIAAALARVRQEERERCVAKAEALLATFMRQLALDGGKEGE